MLHPKMLYVVPTYTCSVSIKFFYVLITVIPVCCSTISTTSMSTPTLTTTTTASSDLDFHEASRLLDRIFQDRENSSLSSSSGDSLSSVSSAGSAALPTGKGYFMV